MVIRNGGRLLTEIPLNGGKINPVLKNFIESSLFFLKFDFPSLIKFSLPPFSVNNLPFSTITNLGCLMTEESPGSKPVMVFDNLTLSVLYSMGWEKNIVNQLILNPDPETVNTGLYVYKPNSFYIAPKEDISDKITSGVWKLRLPLAGGGYEYIDGVSTETLSCTFPALTDIEKYAVKDNGFMYGQIEFECLIDGKKVAAIPKQVQFDAKPYIISQEVYEIEHLSNGQFYIAYFHVRYLGSEKMEVQIQEDGCPYYICKYFNQPNEAYGDSEWLSESLYATITFIATNKYGETVRKIRLAPGGVIE